MNDKWRDHCAGVTLKIWSRSSNSCHHLSPYSNSTMQVWPKSTYWFSPDENVNRVRTKAIYVYASPSPNPTPSSVDGHSELTQSLKHLYRPYHFPYVYQCLAAWHKCLFSLGYMYNVLLVCIAVSEIRDSPIYYLIFDFCLVCRLKYSKSRCKK